MLLLLLLLHLLLLPFHIGGGPPTFGGGAPAQRAAFAAAAVAVAAVCLSNPNSHAKSADISGGPPPAGVGLEGWGPQRHTVPLGSPEIHQLPLPRLPMLRQLRCTYTPIKRENLILHFIRNLRVSFSSPVRGAASTQCCCCSSGCCCCRFIFIVSSSSNNNNSNSSNSSSRGRRRMNGCSKRASCGALHPSLSLLPYGRRIQHWEAAEMLQRMRMPDSSSNHKLHPCMDTWSAAGAAAAVAAAAAAAGASLVCVVAAAYLLPVAFCCCYLFPVPLLLLLLLLLLLQEQPHAVSPSFPFFIRSSLSSAPGATRALPQRK